MDATFPSVISLGRVGYQTDMQSQARSLTHYQKADNIIFEVDGQIRKFGGAEKINSTVITGAPDVTGMCDFWFGGGASAFTQKFVCVTSDGKVYKEDMDGTMDDITGAATITANAIPVFGIANDLLVIAFSTRNTILKWTGTGNVASLSGAPLGKGFIFHANRGWIWDASTIYYSGYDNVEDWTSTDSGHITIQRGDGDEIIGACVYKENLIVFKGPNKGSLHVISGRSPASFERVQLTTGIALQTHNSIIPVGDDVSFMSPRGCHLMSSVVQYGNYAEADITRYLKRHFRELINRSNLSKVWGVNYSEKSCLMWATTTSGGTSNDQIFCLSYSRLGEDGWKAFTVTRDCFSLAIRKHPTTKFDEVVSGGTDGFLRRQDMSTRNIDTSTAYSMNLVTPKLILGANDAGGTPRGDLPITVEDIYVRSEDAGDYTMAGFFTRDNLAAESYIFTLGRGGGFLLGTSVLGTGVLGGGGMEVAYSDPKPFGECRAIQIQLVQSGLNQDANLVELGIEYVPMAETRKSPQPTRQ